MPAAQGGSGEEKNEEETRRGGKPHSLRTSGRKVISGEKELGYSPPFIEIEREIKERELMSSGRVLVGCG